MALAGCIISFYGATSSSPSDHSTVFFGDSLAFVSSATQAVGLLVAKFLKPRMTTGHFLVLVTLVSGCFQVRRCVLCVIWLESSWPLHRDFYSLFMGIGFAWAVCEACVWDLYCCLYWFGAGVVKLWYSVYTFHGLHALCGLQGQGNLVLRPSTMVGTAYISLRDVENCANSVGFRESVPLLPYLCPLSVPDVGVCGAYSESL